MLGFTYNPADQLRTLTDGKQQTTRWNYDPEGRVTNKVDALNAEMFRYQYDPDGQLTNRWQASNVTTTFRYDAVGKATCSCAGRMRRSALTLKSPAAE